MPTSIPVRTEFRFGSNELPSDFAHPPLIEAWLGVEFTDAVDFAKVDAKEWRRRLGPEWQSAFQSIGPAERHAPGMTQVENQLRNVMNDRAIRFGTQGFSFGWLGYDGCIYPRYEAIRDGFVATLDAVRDVLPKIETPQRWAVTYLNRIPQGTVWTTPNDWSFFRLWQPNPLHKLGIDLDEFAGCWQFPLEVERSSLRVEMSHEPCLAAANRVESLWLRITASGPTDTTEPSLFDGLDYGREMIVRAFNELVTADAKSYWGVTPRK